ncbi:MAG TPA: tetratricopeptide repeat protein [Bryobacteraceae bacterium]|nr:tetratricopeptide repeat protein [Bryobacteraceae bacterium]
MVCGCISSRIFAAAALLLLAGQLSPSSVVDHAAEQANAEATRAIEAGHLIDAVAQLQGALRRFPDNHPLQFNLGLALVRLGSLSQAIDPLRKAAADPALAGEAHYLLGVDYFENKQYAPAITELSGPLTAGSRERVLYMLEESYRHTGRVNEAEATFHDLFTHYPDSAWTHYLMGAAYEDQREPDKAQEEYKRAAQIDPTLPNIDFSIGYIYFRQGDIGEAQQWLGKEASEGCHSLANFYLGEIARGNGESQKAEALYHRALTCDASNVDAHLRLGMLFETEKRYPLAIAQFRQAIRVKPNIAPAHYHLASVYRALGRKADSEAEFAKVRKIQAERDNSVDVTKEKQ